MLSLQRRIKDIFASFFPNKKCTSSFNVIVRRNFLQLRTTEFEVGLEYRALVRRNIEFREEKYSLRVYVHLDDRYAANFHCRLSFVLECVWSCKIFIRHVFLPSFLPVLQEKLLIRPSRNILSVNCKQEDNYTSAVRTRRHFIFNLPKIKYPQLWRILAPSSLFRWFSYPARF